MSNIEDRVVATRWLDKDGREVSMKSGIWCDEETGARSEPVCRQVIRESAWTTDLRIRDEANA